MKLFKKFVAWLHGYNHADLGISAQDHRLLRLNQFISTLKSSTIDMRVEATSIVLADDDFSILYPERDAHKINDIAYIGTDNHRDYITVYSRFQWQAKRMIDNEVKSQVNKFVQDYLNAKGKV